MNRQGAKAAKGLFGWASGGVVVAGVGLVIFSACGGRESTSQTTPGNGNGSGGGAAVGDAAAGAAGGAPTDEMTACTGRDCTLVSVQCCSCWSDGLSHYEAVNIRYADALGQQRCQSGGVCVPCSAPPVGIPTVQSSLVALCVVGRCQAVDLRRSTYSECKANTDCAIQYGTGCCDGCGNEELIAINPAAGLHRELCGDIEPPCVPPDPQCIAQRTGSPMAVCSATTGHCEVVGLEQQL